MTSTNTTVLDSPSGAGADLPGRETPVSTIDVALLTGGIDRPYVVGLSRALIAVGIRLDVVGSKEMDDLARDGAADLRFLNLHGDSRQKASLAGRLWRHATSYRRLIGYGAAAKPKIFHILWNYKFQLFDRTVLMLYYKGLGKKVVMTAHNVNTAERDGSDSALNRWSLRVQYRLTDHIFVHTEKMQQKLVEDFEIGAGKVSVIPFGINDSVPDTDLSVAEAKRRVGVKSSEKTILFYGRIRAYKGLEYLVAAFQQIAAGDNNYRLIIAGEPKKESLQYWRDIQRTIEREETGKRVIQEIRFVPDEETELYFKAADVLVLPYTEIFQSGVLFLAYGFGLPVIATDVGSLRDDIIEGQTGFVCRPSDAADLADVLKKYFDSSLFRALDRKRGEIKAFARSHNSWNVVGDITRAVYGRLLAKRN
jgi:glycosyltransferase involved in cell wall biosynthesis